MQSLRLQTSAILFSDVITFSDVNPNDGVPWRPIQPVYIKHVKMFNFYLTHGTDKGVW